MTDKKGTPVINKGGLVRRGALAQLQATKGLLELDRITDLLATPNRVFYSDADGEVQEIAFGASGTVLASNGATSAPSFGSGGAWVPRVVTVSF